MWWFRCLLSLIPSHQLRNPRGSLGRPSTRPDKNRRLLSDRRDRDRDREPGPRFHLSSFAQRRAWFIFTASPRQSFDVPDIYFTLYRWIHLREKLNCRTAERLPAFILFFMSGRRTALSYCRSGVTLVCRSRRWHSPSNQFRTVHILTPSLRERHEFKFERERGRHCSFRVIDS